MNKLLTIAFVIFCASVNAQTGLHSFAERYVNEDLKRFNPDFSITSGHGAFAAKLNTILSGFKSDDVLQFNLNIEGNEIEMNELQQFGKTPGKSTSTYVGDGKLDGLAFEMFTTIFTDSTLLNIRIAKQVAYIHFTEQGTEFEVLCFDFETPNGYTLHYLIWKELYQSMYFKTVTEAPLINTPELKSASGMDINKMIVTDMLGKVVASQYCNCAALCRPESGLLAPGMYILTSVCQPNSTGQKFVVTH